MMSEWLGHEIVLGSSGNDGKEAADKVVAKLKQGTIRMCESYFELTTGLLQENPR